MFVYLCCVVCACREEHKQLGRRRYAFRQNLLEVRGKRVVQQMMKKFSDFRHHFLEVGQFSETVRSQFETRFPNSYYLPDSWRTQPRHIGLMRDHAQRQEEIDPEVLEARQNEPARAWIHPLTGVEYDIKEWVVRHLVSDSYERGGVNPLSLFEFNLMLPTTPIEKEEQDAMMEKVAGKPHLVRMPEAR